MVLIKNKKCSLDSASAKQNIDFTYFVEFPNCHRVMGTKKGKREVNHQLYMKETRIWGSSSFRIRWTFEERSSLAASRNARGDAMAAAVGCCR